MKFRFLTIEQININMTDFMDALSHFTNRSAIYAHFHKR